MQHKRKATYVVQTKLQAFFVIDRLLVAIFVHEMQLFQMNQFYLQVDELFDLNSDLYPSIIR